MSTAIALLLRLAGDLQTSIGLVAGDCTAEQLRQGDSCWRFETIFGTIISAFWSADFIIYGPFFVLHSGNGLLLKMVQRKRNKILHLVVIA